MCPNLHTVTTFSPLSPTLQVMTFSSMTILSCEPQTSINLRNYNCNCNYNASHTRLSLSFSLLHTLCGFHQRFFFPTCLPHEILFISCLLSALRHPHQVQIAVQAWMDEEDRVKSYTTKMEMEICKNEMKWNAYAYGRHMKEQWKKKRSWRRSGKPNWKVNVKIYESLNWKAGKMRRRCRLHWLAAESGKTWLKVVEHATDTERQTEREKGKRGRGRAGSRETQTKMWLLPPPTRGQQQQQRWLFECCSWRIHTAQRRAADTSACIYVCLVCPNIDLSHGQGRSWWWWWCCWDNQKLLQLWEELSSLCGE